MVAARNSRLEELHFLELESAEKTKVDDTTTRFFAMLWDFFHPVGFLLVG